MKHIDIIIEVDLIEILCDIAADAFWYGKFEILWESKKVDKDPDMVHIPCYYEDPYDLIRMGMYIQIARDKRLKMLYQSIVKSDSLDC